MKIEAFQVEEWMNEYEMGAEYNIAETCVESLTVEELLTISGKKGDFLKEFLETQLTYGHIEGSPEFKESISNFYKDINPENILATHGAAGANFLVFYSLVEPGDEVISVMPTYQQLYSIPESFGAEVKPLWLRPENNFLPDLDELNSLISSNTKMICINNPNNPTGALMKNDFLGKIVDIARQSNIFILSDEVYRGLYQNEINVPSIVDLYEKGISTGSMSKVFSLAGLRLGWVVAARGVIQNIQQHRDYNTISCGMVDDMLAVLALRNYEKILKRNHKIVKKNLQILDNWVQNEKSISYKKPDAGTTAFLKYYLDLPSDQLCKELLKKTGTLLVPGKCFGMDKYLRIGYAGNTDELRAGLDNLSGYIKAQL